MPVVDIIGREINPNDYVVYFSNIYKVLGVTDKPNQYGKGAVRMILAKPSKTTRPITKYSNDVAVLDARYVTLWMIKQ